MQKLLASLLVLTASGCPSVTLDTDEGGGEPTVEFDPSNKIIPFPNNLLLDPATGKVALPQQCNESATSTATRAAINQLDGFGAYEPTLNVTFTEAVDVASLQNRVLLFQRVRAGTALDPLTATPIPVVAIPGQTIRYGNTADITACTDPAMVTQVTFVPTRALDQKSTYTVALLDGIKTAMGADFAASFTWSLIRHPEPVVVIDADNNVITNRTPLNPLDPADRASLAGVDLLWKAHAQGLSFLAGNGHDPEDILLAWEFNTQTITDPLDPLVSGSPASSPTVLPMLFGANPSVSAIANSRAGAFAACAADDPISDADCFMRIALGLAAGASGTAIYPTGRAACTAAGCAAINDVMSGLVLSKQYQVDVANTTYTGTGTQPIPGPWSDPVKPAIVHDTTNPNPLLNAAQTKLGALVIIPVGTAPAAGWPTVIFQHGITRSRGDVLAIAGNLAATGYAVVAIDAVNHGSRAVRTVKDTACPDVSVGLLGPRPDLGPDPSAFGDCYAPVLSPNLAATRDSFRQTVLDLHQLVTSLKACGTTACGKLKVDPARILFLGHSLVGGNFGAILTSMRTDIKAAVFNAAGAGWLDIIENTDAMEDFQCPLVDALIDAGFLTGAKYDANAMTGLCTTDTWKTAPGYRQFAAIGRWMLDPSDPANFAARLAPKKFLLQSIDEDEVTPNIATDNLGALAGQPRANASCGTVTNVGTTGNPNLVFLPSSVVLATPTESMFLEYLSYAPASAECPPGNTFGHGSLLKPENNATDGNFATQRLRVDAIFYFTQND